MKLNVLLAWSWESVGYNRETPISRENNTYKLFLVNVLGEKSFKLARAILLITLCTSPRFLPNRALKNCFKPERCL